MYLMRSLALDPKQSNDGGPIDNFVSLKIVTWNRKEYFAAEANARTETNNLLLKRSPQLPRETMGDHRGDHGRRQETTGDHRRT